MNTERERELSDQLIRIISLAKRGSESDWQEIDKVLPTLSQESYIVNWAKTNLDNSSSNLQDLAASIIEQTDFPIDEHVINRLFELLLSDNPDNPYPSFRAACALAKRSGHPTIRPRIREILQKIKLYIDDQDVSDIAKKYINSIDSGNQ